MGGSQGNKLNKKFIKLDLIFGCFFFFFFYCVTSAYKILCVYFVCKMTLIWHIFDDCTNSRRSFCILSRFVYFDTKIFFFSNEHMFVCNVMYSLYVLFYSIYLTLSIFILRGLHVYWIINWCENKITIIDCWHNILNFNN